MFRSITLRNILSFGPSGMTLSLNSVNILIGANGCGKSNLIDCIAVMRNTPNDPTMPIIEGGGFDEWRYKGHSSEEHPYIKIETELMVIFHELTFDSQLSGISFRERVSSDRGDGEVKTVLETTPTAVIIDGEKLENAKFDSRKSVVQQLSGHPDVFELAELSICYENIRVYRDWSFGRNQSIRLPQSASQKNDFLNEDYRNLGLILNKIKFDLPTKRKIIEELQRFVPTATGFDTLVQAGTIQIYLEEGEFSTPAIRLSDGTLRYLTLLTILCDPKPPGLVCIEEPELGLHPDIIPEIARLIQEASTRCQLIITTHSQTLVDAFSEQPEAIVVCERGEDGTQMGRLPPELLKEWLQTYSLGELWSRGHLGGNRW